MEIDEDIIKNKTNLIGIKYKDYIKELSQHKKFENTRPGYYFAKASALFYHIQLNQPWRRVGNWHVNHSHPFISAHITQFRHLNDHI